MILTHRVNLSCQPLDFLEIYKIFTTCHDAGGPAIMPRKGLKVSLLLSPMVTPCGYLPVITLPLILYGYSSISLFTTTPPYPFSVSIGFRGG